MSFETPPNVEPKTLEKPSNEKLLEGQLLGRAEYENIKDKDLFEDKDPREIFPWAPWETEEGYGQGMIIAPRGSGKTFLIRQIMDEIPSELHVLDKKTLEYVKVGSEKPQMMILDDLHYLLEARKLDELNKLGPRITEEKILDMLGSAIQKAKDDKIKVMFSSTESPVDLASRFTNKGNAEKFLNLFDINISRKIRPEGQNILYFREKFGPEFIENLRKQIKAIDIPLLNYRFENESHLIAPGDIERLGRAGVTKSNLKKKDIFIKEKGLPDPSLITRVRELVALSEELGGLNRETLGLNLGVPLDKTSTGEPTSSEVIEGQRVANSDFVNIFNQYDNYIKDISAVRKEYVDEQNRKIDRFNQEIKLQADKTGKEPKFVSRIKIAPDSNKRLFNFFLESRLGIKEPLMARIVVDKRSEGIREIQVGNILGSYNRSGRPSETYIKGEANKGDGWVYSSSDIDKLKQGLHDMYFDLTRDSTGDTLAGRLLALNENATPEEVEKVFLEHSIGQE